MGLLKDSIDGLEIIFPKDRERLQHGYSLLILGGSGKGKSTLAYQMMNEYLKKKGGKEFGIYITFEQSQNTLRKQLDELEVFKQNPGIIIRDHIFLQNSFAKKAQEAKEKIKKLEDALEGIKKIIKEKREGAEFILKIEEIQTGMETLVEYAGKIPIGEGKQEVMSEVEILKAHDIDLDTRKALILGKIGDELAKLGEKEKTVQTILADFKRILSEYAGFLNASAFSFVEFAINEAAQMIPEGKFPFIKKDAKLGVVVIDSLQLVEADLEIGDNEDKIRKILGRFIRKIMEMENGLNIIGILEAKGERSKKHPDTLPETFAFDTTVHLRDKEGEDPNKMLFEFVVVKHRGPHKMRVWPYTIVEKQGIVFAPNE